MKTTIKLLLFILLVCGAGQSFAQSSYPLKGHPRLFFLEEDEKVLTEKIYTEPILSHVNNAIISECDKIIPLAVKQRVLIGKRLLAVSREALRRIGYLSYAYRMTGDSKYAKRAEAEMLAMAAFPDWNPKHFLDVAEMTLAVAIGYDWCFDYLSTTSRETIASAIRTKGIDRTTGEYGNQGWMRSDNNWNQVCNAGISAGVAALYHEDTAYYQPLIDRAVNQIKIPMGVYKNNGAYPEGPMYWGYGTNFNILFIDLIQRMWGTDSDLLSIPGFLNTTDFVTHTQGNATKELNGATFKNINPPPFNFADCSSGSGVEPGMFWLATQKQDPNVLYNEVKKLAFQITNRPSSLVRDRLLPFLLIWGMNFSYTNLQPPMAKTYVGQGEGALAAMRSGWGGKDIYLGIKGGTPSGNHAHMDVGSFVMDANEVRWAMDFGMESYSTMEANGVSLWGKSQDSERWDVFRYNNMAHNTLTINGHKQLVSGHSTIDNLVNTPELKSVDLDLTSLYSTDVSSCRRTASIVSSRYVEIKDELTAKATNLTIRWNLLTVATPRRVTDKILRLEQADKVLYLLFEGTDAVKAKTWSTKPPTSYENKNSGTYFTGFEYTVPAGASQTITVKLVPEGDALLKDMNLEAARIDLNETFESFEEGASSGSFVDWGFYPTKNGSYMAVMGGVTTNPLKDNVNSSDNVLRIERQYDPAITLENAGKVTYRGTRAFGYNLDVSTNTLFEFKYYKDVESESDNARRIGIRVYDANSITGETVHVAIDYTDPDELKTGNKAKWRTAQFNVAGRDFSSFENPASPSGDFLSILPERNASVAAYQSDPLVMYIDDIKLLRAPITDVRIHKNEQLSAFYDKNSGQICVSNLSVGTRMVRLYDLTGRFVHEVLVAGDIALLDTKNTASACYIVEATTTEGLKKTVKVLK